MVGLLTAREKFDCCVALGIIKEAHFFIVTCPEDIRFFLVFIS